MSAVLENLEAVWEPNPGPQEAFLACPIYEVLYGGAAGGGKSDALLIDALGQVHNKNYKAVIFRRSYPELEELILRSLDLYPVAFPGAKFKDSKKRWDFPSGAKLYFRYMESDKDAKRYQGQSFTYVGFDELTHFSEFQYTYLIGRCRSSDPTLERYIRATTNPGGPGHNWVKARFVDAAPPMSPVLDPRTKRERVFIPALLVDNPHLDRTGYGDDLEALNDADKKALKDGDWNAYEGEVFNLETGIHRWTWAQFKERTGHDKIPAEWTRFRSMDWGYAKPFAVYWYAVDYEGRAYVYREWYGCQKDSNGKVVPNEGIRMEPEKVAEKIAAIEKDTHEKPQGIADPACWAKGKGDYGGGPSIAEAMQKHGIHWSPGKNDRVSGKMALHQRLAYEKNSKGELREYPGLIFIAEECPHALRTIPALTYDEHRVEDVNTDGEDHAYDSVRYFCMSRPWMPRRQEKRDGWRERNQGGSSWIGG